MAARPQPTLTSLYRLINEKGKKISESSLFQNEDFAACINSGMTQLHIWARDHPTTDPSTKDPDMLVKLEDLCRSPSNSSTTKSPNPTPTTPTASRARRINVATLACSTVPLIKLHLEKIDRTLERFIEGDWQRWAPLWDGVPCPPVIALLSVGHDFCREVRGLGEYSEDIARVIGRESSGRIEVSEIYGTEKESGRGAADVV